MQIAFNNYKGFVIDEEISGNKVDIRSGLVPLKPGGLKKSSEYKTCGFDALDVAWNIGYKTDSIDDNSYKLRDCAFEFQTSVVDLSELSSHTTLYGEDVLVDADSEDDGDDDEIVIENTKKGKNKNKYKANKKDKNKKLTSDERKQQRKQARESKKSAKQARKRNMLNNELSESTTPKSQCQEMKRILQECFLAVTEKLGDEIELQDTTRILNLDDVALYVSDLRNLLDDEWLSDSNIGWAYTFLYQAYILPLLEIHLKNSKFNQYNSDLNKDVFVSPIKMMLPTFTFLIANHPDPMDLVEANVLGSDLSQSQIVFCPLNDNDDFGTVEGGSHWSLVVFVKLLEKGKREYTQKAFVFDSMFEANAKETQNLVNNMSVVLHDPKDTKSTTRWETIHVRESPQQTNGSDCGVYVCAVSAYLVSQLVSLLNSAPGDYIDFGLKNLRFTPANTRIWMLSTILNFLKS